MNNQFEFFSNLKVIELAGVLAGPAVGMFFAELGATVIKVEHPDTGGDMTRHWRLKEEDPQAEVSAYYASVNYGKRVKWLDLEKELDRIQLYNELADTDIIISNFKRKSAQRLEINAAVLLQKFPKLIYGQIDAFGANEDRPAFDAVLQAEVGLMHMNGYPDAMPAKLPVALIDILAAHQLKEGLLMALLERERSGRGQLVSTSLFNAALASLANQASNYLMAGKVAERMGTQHPNIAPYGEIFKTKDDKLILLAIGTDRQFLKLCEVLGMAELAKDERFNQNEKRVIHREKLFELLLVKIEKWEREKLMKVLIEAKVPAGAIRNLAEVFELEAAQKMVIEEELEGMRTRVMRTVGFEIGGGF